MNPFTLALILTICWLGPEPPKGKPNTQDCPMHKAHDSHDTMNARGEHAMGFSQTATTHHFLLTDTGGTIQVDANRPTDKESIEEIRMHLSHIAQSFADGDFEIPMFVHDTLPPGVPEMKKLKANIHYSFEETPTGGRVLISTSKKSALEAIHAFLRFQIAEHKTGDPTGTHR